MAEATRTTKITRSVMKENPGLTDFGQRYAELPLDEKLQFDNKKTAGEKSLGQAIRSTKRHLQFVNNNINKPTFALIEAEQLFRTYNKTDQQSMIGQNNL